jgi:hypothetical protein
MSPGLTAGPVFFLVVGHACPALPKFIVYNLTSLCIAQNTPKLFDRGVAALPDNRPLYACARCGQVMQLIRTFPRLGMVPEMHVFVCNSCGEVKVEEIPQQAVG